MRILRILLSRINKMWLLLGVAILLGLAATWVTLQYLKVREQRIEADVKKRASGGATVEVVAVARNLPKGAVVGADNLVKREILEDLVYEETVLINEFDKVDGLKLARAVEGGRPLRRSDLDIKAKDFSEALPQGTRAITIDVDEINSVSQMVRPGNLVDLMLIVADPNDPAGGQQVVSLLQKVKVLATGQIIARSADRDVATKGGAAAPGGALFGPSSTTSTSNTPQRYSNFTFEVTPEEAARIALAQQLGKIRAVLRNDDDQRMDPLAKINSHTLLQGYVPGGKKGQQQAEARPSVEFIIGGKGGGGVGTTVNVNMTSPLGAGAPAAGAPPAAAVPPAPPGTGQVNIPGIGNVPYTAPSSATMSGGAFGVDQRRP
jgi:pilus assembly protein CpaB